MVATPTGNITFVKIFNYVLSPPVIRINPGDAVEWNNIDDDNYIAAERDNKLSNISVRSGKRTRHIFNQTGEYHFIITYSGLRTAPKEQDVIVKVNAGQ